MQLVQAVSLVHGERCFYPELRQALAPATLSIASMSKEMHSIQLANIHRSLFSFWEDSTDVLRHLEPIWQVSIHAARFVEAFDKVLHTLNQGWVTIGEGAFRREDSSETQENFHDSGAFSDMHYITRQLLGGWHLDHGLIASLMRIWIPPAGWTQNTDQEDSHAKCHTTVADLGWWRPLL